MAPSDKTTTNLKEYTLDEVSKHNSRDSCWLIIGNSSNGGPKVYDVTKYLDDHPGGAEVMMDVSGGDADEFFEDIGHSKEARTELAKHLIGTYKIDAATLAKMKADAEAKAKASGGGSGLLVFLVAALAIAYAYFQFQSTKYEQDQGE